MNGEGRRIKIIRLGSLPPAPPVKWLWQTFVPYGFLTLCEGEEGIGKGYLAAWLAMRTVRAMRAVVWLTSEETAHKVQARLAVLGYDPEVHAPIILLEVSDDSLITMPKDRDNFVALAKQLGVPIGLIVVDVLRDHSDLTGAPEVRNRSNNDETWIRPAARSWERLAETLDCAVLGLHHRNKSSEGTARSKSTGSGAWRQASRHVIVLARVHGQCALAVDKTNVTKEDKQPVDYCLEVVDLDGADDNTEAVFSPGDRTGHRDIDDWEKEMAKATEIDLTEPVEVAIRDKYQVGEIVTKTDLLTVLPLTERQLRQVIKNLTGTGALTFVRGRGYQLNASY